MNEKILMNLKIYFRNNYNKLNNKNKIKFEEFIFNQQILLNYKDKFFLKESEEFEIIPSKMNK
jgi:hypothetical protein